MNHHHLDQTGPGAGTADRGMVLTSCSLATCPGGATRRLLRLYFRITEEFWKLELRLKGTLVGHVDLGS